MFRRILLFNCIIFFSLSVFVQSCSKTGPKGGLMEGINLPSDGESVINASNDFAFHFLHATLQQDSVYDNKLISPLSIYIALSMAYNGAGGATKDSIANCLMVSGIDIESLNTTCNALITQLPLADNKVQLSIANSIWYRQNGYQPYDTFLNLMNMNYAAQVQSLN